MNSFTTPNMIFLSLTMWKGAQNKCNIVAYPGCTIGGHVTCSFDIILRYDHPLNLSRLIAQK